MAFSYAPQTYQSMIAAGTQGGGGYYNYGYGNAPGGGIIGNPGGASPGGSWSSSTSWIPNYPEEAWLLGLSQAAGQHSADLIGQAANTFGGTSALTNEAANNFLSMSQQSLNQANQMWGRYTGLFQPEEDQLLAEARQYASVPRMQLEMGKAGATAAQAADQAREASLQNLRDYGINVDSGRFAGLDRAAQAQKAASVAAAENQAREATQAAGRAMRSEAIQVGERYPSQIANALQQAQAGQAGAVNATMANARAFGELMQPGLAALQSAMSLKYPPLGTMSQSASQQWQPNPPGGGGGGGGSKGGGQGGGGGGHPSGGGGYGGGYGGQQGGGSGPGWVPNPYYQGPDGGGGGEPQGPCPDGSPIGADGTCGGDGGDDYTQEANMPAPDDYTSPEVDPSIDPEFSGDGGAQGGVVQFQIGGSVPPTTGGFVSRALSPSGGIRTDDIPARLNANEYVIPRDVATWKGHEFFQNLINKSRKARTGATAKPTFRPPSQSQGIGIR